MSYSFKQDEIETFVSSGSKELNFVFPKNKGFCTMKKEIVCDDILLLKNNISAKDDILIDYNLEDTSIFSDTLCINFILQGKMKVDIVDLKDEIVYEKSRNIIFSLKETDNKAFMQKNDNLSSISIFLNKNFIRRNIPNFEKFEKSKRTKLLKNSLLNPKSKILAQEIYNNPFTNELEGLFLQSKVLEIIYLELSTLNQNKEKAKIIFSEYDKNALLEAKNILENDLSSPLTIPELAKKVHLNEFKLKFGFKKFYNETPYQISLKSRLNYAKKLIAKDYLSMSEISQKVGFKHQQNFTNAFTRHFGIRPKDVLKLRKFYIEKI